MLTVWFDAVFRGARQAEHFAAQGQFVRARMIIKRSSAILRHSGVLPAVRLEIKARHAQTTPP